MKVLAPYVFVVEGLAINKRIAAIKSSQRRRKDWLMVNLAPHQRSVRKWRNLIPTLVHGC